MAGRAAPGDGDGALGCGTIEVTKGEPLSDDDARIVRHLFSGSGGVELRQFGAGFSGANVYLGQARSADGAVALAPCVVKLGPAEMVLGERWAKARTRSTRRK